MLNDSQGPVNQHPSSIFTHIQFITFEALKQCLKEGEKGYVGPVFFFGFLFFFKFHCCFKFVTFLFLLLFGDCFKV